MKLVFIQTGGTIDKDYPHTTKGWAFEFGEPATKRILEKLNPSFEYEVLTSCQKDSLEITEEDRNSLAKPIR
jgi:L-asparaginase